MLPSPGNEPVQRLESGADGAAVPSSPSHTSERQVIGPQFLEQISGINITVEKKAGVFEVRFSDAPGTLKIYPDGQFVVAGSLKTPDHRISIEKGEGRLVISFIERGIGASFKRVVQELIGAEGATSDYFARLKVEGDKLSINSSYVSRESTLTFNADGTAHWQS
ncbi:MAG: hypothetical protein K1X79_05715 [Oligoflexia bacterium]|nr:hypothetical protein [Oligoflexia bacterium]